MSGRRLPAIAAASGAIALALVIGGMQATSGGYRATVTNSVNKAGTAQAFTCAEAISQNATNAYFAYRLNDATGSTTAPDISGHSANNGVYRGIITNSVTNPIACPRDSASSGAWAPAGNTFAPSSVIAPVQVTNPTTFSLEVWFRNTTKSGRIISFGTSNGVAGTNSLLGSYDRALYINSSGNLVFGMTATSAISTATATGSNPKTYIDGAWHQAIVTVTAGTPATANASVRLYIDGAQFASASLAAAGNYNGYWRIGWDTQVGWADAGTNDFFNGGLRFAAAYNIAFTASQVTAHYVAGIPK
jgi:Concanavalin A-like lectin/glucanases superfamily